MTRTATACRSTAAEPHNSFVRLFVCLFDGSHGGGGLVVMEVGMRAIINAFALIANLVVVV
jgi:hypothetical protein